MTTGTDLILLPHTGELVDPGDAEACVKAIEDLRLLEARLAEARRALVGAAAEYATVRGVKSFRLADGRTAQLTGGPARGYDADVLERGLREAGMPEDRIREIVVEEVSYKVAAVEAKRAAGANPAYAQAVERAAVDTERPYGLAVRR